MTTASEYRAVQLTGKTHRARFGGVSTLCGITITGGWSWFPERESLAEDRCARCWRSRRPTVDEMIADYVNRATRSYAWGAPGHGEYLLTRLALKLDRLSGDQPWPTTPSS